MQPRTSPVAALLFGSGFCALVYQTGWLREFRLIFGASTAASAAVLAIFIGGLGAGGLLLGPRADRHPRPLLFYATLEAIVAVSAALSPWLLSLVRTVYLATGGSTRIGIAAATIERLILSVLVLAVPTLAMGGTLPAAARAVTRVTDARRQDLAMLYATNTLGAVAGCMFATFFLLEVFGTRQTLWLAAAVNLIVAITARAIDRQWADTQVRPYEAGVGADLRVGPTLPAPPALPALPDPPDPPDLSGRTAPLPFLLAASAVVGFAFFLMELVWYRLLGPLLGGSVFTFGLVLAVALVGIGVGGLLYALVSSDRPATLGGFAASCLLEALAIAATFALGDRIAVLALALLPLRTAGFVAHIAGWTIVTTLVVLPPAVIAGYQFPLLVALFGRGREAVGRQVGLAYAANTAGAIAGSLAGGFGLLPWLSASGAWRLTAAVLVALGATASILDVQRKAREDRKDHLASRPLRPLRSNVVNGIAIAVTIALLFSTGPTAVWRHSGIGAGRTSSDVFASPNQLRAWQQAARRAVVWGRDGVESSVALAAESNGYAFIVNGKSDGSARGDAGTQVMLGLLGAMRHPDPKTSLVVGLGTGSTAGWLGVVPSMQRVDVVELEPLVLDIARVSTAVNQDVVKNSRVHVTIGDAREVLLTGRDRYDVIASEPSNPFRAGIASLFTVEYYRAASARLTEDGVFAQWVQGYEIDARTLRTIYATMAAVFPQVETWQTNQGDLVLLAMARPRGYQLSALRQRMAQEPYRSALANAWRAVDINGLLAHYLASDALTRTFASVPSAAINTDDQNLVEFGLARSVGLSGSQLVAEVRQAARSINASHPPFDREDGISWPAADTAWTAFAGWNTAAADARAVPPEEQHRQTALRLYYQSGDSPGARALWHRLADPNPRDPWELAMVADVEADAGSSDALPLIERLRAYQPAEADTVLAAYQLRLGRLDAATAALEAALTRYRSDPWPDLKFKQEALAIATVIATRDPSQARRLFDALRQPFAVRAIDNSRLLTALDLATRFDFKGECRAPLHALEPHVPWTQEFLVLRRACYEQTGDPLLGDATRDLLDYLAHEPSPLQQR